MAEEDVLRLFYGQTLCQLVPVKRHCARIVQCLRVVRQPPLHQGKSVIRCHLPPDVLGVVVSNRLDPLQRKLIRP